MTIEPTTVLARSVSMVFEACEPACSPFNSLPCRLFTVFNAQNAPVCHVRQGGWHITPYRQRSRQSGTVGQISGIGVNQPLEKHDRFGRMEA